MSSGMVSTSFNVQYPEHGRILIPGDPYGKRAPQIARRGKHAHLHPHPADKEYAALIMVELEAGRFGVTWRPIRDPRAALWVHIEARFQRPPSHFLADGESLSAAGREFIEPTKRPDADNISKIILDTFTHAGVWPDDAQVTRNVQEKVFADEAGVLVAWGVKAQAS